MKRYFCDICGSEVDKDNIAGLLAMDIEMVVVEEWGDLCQKCRDRLSKTLRDWKARAPKKTEN